MYRVCRRRVSAPTDTIGPSGIGKSGTTNPPLVSTVISCSIVAFAQLALAEQENPRGCGTIDALEIDTPTYPPIARSTTT